MTPIPQSRPSTRRPGAEFVRLSGDHLPRRSDAAEQLEFQRPGGFSDLRPSGENRGPWAGEPDASDDHVIGAGGAGYTNTDGAGNTGWAGGGQPHFNIQPTTYINFMIKL